MVLLRLGAVRWLWKSVPSFPPDKIPRPDNSGAVSPLPALLPLDHRALRRRTRHRSRICLVLEVELLAGLAAVLDDGG